VHGDVAWKQLPSLLVEATTLIGSLILIIVLAFGLNDFLAEVDAPGVIRNWVETADLSAWQFMLLVNIILIVLGALMDSISATLVFAPILAPVAIQHYGIDPIHFGIVFVVNMEIGYLAPPVATNLFVAAAIFRQPFVEVAKAIMPTLSIICGALLILIYVPSISLAPLHARDGGALWVDFPWNGKVEVAPEPGLVPVDGAAAPDAAQPDAQPRAMSMEEMMKKAQEAAAKAEAQPEAAQPDAAQPDAAQPVAAQPDAAPRAMSMEEMMKKAKEKVESDAAAAQPKP